MGYPVRQGRHPLDVLFRLIAVAALFALALSLKWDEIKAHVQQAQGVPTVAAGASASLDWHDEMWVEAYNPASPRFQALSYREGLIAGLTWIYGAKVRTRDFDDARLGKTWEVTPPGDGPVIAVELTFHVDGEGRAQARMAGPGGQAILRTMAPYAKDNPLDSGADRALDDLPKVLPLVGGTAWAARTKVAAGQAAGAWQPGGITELAKALEGLRAAPATVAPAVLARAARGLAWTALIDHRVAPTLAVTRAAQALAFASVAERLAGAPVAEAAAARWLAPGAAIEDFWLLSQKAPPAGNPDLELLHGVYAAPELTEDLPDGLIVPAVVARCARAQALGESYLTAKLMPALTRRPEGLSMASYLGSFTEFSVVARTYQAAARLVLTDLALARAANPAAGAKAAQDAAHKLRGSELDSARFTVKRARELLRESVAAPELVDRIVLQEGGERLLRSLELTYAAYSQYGWTPQKKALGQALRESEQWWHPTLQWLLTETALSGRSTDPRKNFSARVAGAASSYLPGLQANDLDRLNEDDLLQTALVSISNFPDHPGQVERAMLLLTRTGYTGVIAGLLDWMQRTAGKDRLPLFNTYSGYAAALKRMLIVPHAPKAFELLPLAARDAALRLSRAGKVAQMRTLLARAQEKYPSSSWLVTTSRELCVAHKDYDGAIAATKRYLATRPPGLTGYSMALDLSEDLLKVPGRDPSEALELSRFGASSAAQWAYERHALACAFAGLEDEGRRALADAEEHYGPARTIEQRRALLTLFGSKGAKGWSELEAVHAGVPPSGLKRTAAALQRLSIALPNSEFGRLLKVAAFFEPLAVKLQAGAIENADLEPVLDALAATGPKAKEFGQEFEKTFYDFAGSALTRQLLAGKACEVPPVLKRYVALCGVPPLDALNDVVESADLSGANDEQLAKVLVAVLPLADPRDRAVLEAVLRDPGGLRRWVGTAQAGLPQHAIQAYLEYLWLTGRDAALRDVCTALLGQAPRDIGWGLAMATGSPDAARAYLAKHGVSPAGFGDWGVNTRIFPHLRQLLTHFRPDGSNLNPLAP